MKRMMILVLVLLSIHAASAKEQKVKEFLKDNPKSVAFDVISEGTNIYLAADEEYIVMTMTIAHPALQMKFLMQGVSFFIDPTGKKKEKHAVFFPSARDVEEEMKRFQPTPQSGNQQHERPDVRPLIEALNRCGAIYDINGRQYPLADGHFMMELDVEKEMLVYYIMIPKSELMKEKKLSDIWSVGIYSNNFEQPPMDERPDFGPPQPNGNVSLREKDTNKTMKAMAGKIDVWERFSIDEVNNVNLGMKHMIDNDDMFVEAERMGDVVELEISSVTPQKQLSLLMQGLTMEISSGSSAITVIMPSAYSVKDKIPRHPNEVKPVFRGNNGTDEVRPDIQPIISALSEEQMRINVGSDILMSDDFTVNLIKDEGKLSYSVRLDGRYFPENVIDLCIKSSPSSSFVESEFQGQKLSHETGRNPGGLGSAPERPDDPSRVIEYNIRLNIK